MRPLKNYRTGVYHMKDKYNKEDVSLVKHHKEDETEVINKKVTDSNVDRPTIGHVNLQNCLKQGTSKPTMAPSTNTKIAPRMVTCSSKITYQKCMDDWIPTMSTLKDAKLSIRHLTPTTSRTSAMETSGLVYISMRHVIHQ